MHSDEITFLERLAEETTWGRYLANIQKNWILRGEALAERRGQAIDLGCGGGRWSKLMSDRGWEVTSTDIDPHSLAVCQRKVPNAKCILAQASEQSIPAATGSFQVVLCMEVPQLVEAEWLPHEVHRALSDRGIVMGVEFNLHSWRSAVWHSTRHFRQAFDASYTISYIRWRKRLLRSGFTMLHEEAFCWGPFSRNSNSRFVPGFARAERALGLDRIVRWGPWILFMARKI